MQYKEKEKKSIFQVLQRMAKQLLDQLRQQKPTQVKISNCFWKNNVLKI